MSTSSSKPPGGLLFPNPQGLSPSNTTFSIPNLSGAWNLCEIFEHHASKSPSHVWTVWDDHEITEDGEKRSSKVTYAEWWKALQTAARFLVKHVNLSPSTTLEDCRTIAILATIDQLSYVVLIQAIVYLGHVAFPISHANSVPAIVHLLSKTNCNQLIVSGGELIGSAAAAACVELEKERSHGAALNLVEAPGFFTLFPRFGRDGETQSTEEHRPVRSSRRPNYKETAMIIHSSGSTNFPKPIPLTHQLCLQWMRMPWYGAGDFCGLTMGALGLPPFHVMGLAGLFWLPMSSGLTAAVFKPYDTPTVPSAETVLKGLRANKCRTSLVVPIFIEAWAKNPETVDFLTTLDSVLFAGGPLPVEVGTKLAKQGVKLSSVYGATEMGVPNVFGVPTSHYTQDYTGRPEWLKFSTQFNLRLEPQEQIQMGAEKDTYELVILTNEHNTPAVFNNHEKTEYATRDLVILHPEDKTLFKVIGRVDDQIMLSTGEKINPVPMEHIMTTSLLIERAVMFGRGKTQGGVILQPSVGKEIDPTDEGQLSAYRSAVWEMIEEANRIAPRHSRILKEMILVTSPTKPFPLTPKRTILRYKAIELYKLEIELCYDASERSAEFGKGVTLPVDWDEERETVRYVREMVGKVMKAPTECERDLFQFGLDSLGATYLRNSIVAGLRVDHKDVAARIPSDFVFKNPSILLLASALRAEASSTYSLEFNPEASQVEAMKAAIRKYTHTLPIHVPDPTYPAPNASEEVVVLTGTTGGLGSHLLAQLIDTKTVARVYALNRKSGKPLWERQAAVLAERLGSDSKAWEVMRSDKLRLVEATLEEEDLGIEKELYEEIRTSATMIIHNAWRLDFNLSLASFTPQVASVTTLAKLALRSPHSVPPRILFTSSVATVSTWTSPKPVPEEPLHDLRIAVGNGYGESKAVAEKILENVSETTPVKTTNFRIGQLSGSSGSGAWATSDWVPLIARGGQEVGCLPDGPGPVTWLAIDVAAAAILEARHSSAQTLHIVNPHTTSWSSVMASLSASLNLGVVPFNEWVTKLEGSIHHEDPDAMKRNPALALLEFYKRLNKGFASASQGNDMTMGREAGGLARLRTEKAMKASASLNDAPRITGEDVERWVAYWRSKGLLKA